MSIEKPKQICPTRQELNQLWVAQERQSTGALNHQIANHLTAMDWMMTLAESGGGWNENLLKKYNKEKTVLYKLLGISK